MNYRRTLLFLLVLACWGFYEAATQILEAELTDDDPTVLEGEALTMNCTITQSISNYDSSDLFLLRGNEEISEEYLTRPDNLTLSLNITPRVEWSGGHIYCKAREYTGDGGYLKTLSHQVLTVLKIPEQPVITGCKVYSWTRMVCEWTPSAEEQSHKTGMVVNQQLVWVLSRHPCRQKPTECKEHINTCPRLKNPTTCEWLPPGAESSMNYFRSDEDYTIAIKVNYTHPASGISGTLPFREEKIESRYLVQPGAIEGMHVEPGTRSLNVSWNNKPIGRRLIINIHIEQLSDPGMPTLIMNKTHVDNPFHLSAQELTGEYEGWLRPNTRYRVVLRQIPYFNISRVGALGFWSDPTYQTVETKPDVPARTPTLTSGLYRRWENGQVVQVEVFWKHLERRYQHGKPKHVLIHYIDTSSELSLGRYRRELQSGALSSTSSYSQLAPSCKCEPRSCTIVKYSDAVTWAELPPLRRSRTFKIYIELENEMGCNPAHYLDDDQTPIIISQQKNSVAAPVHFVARQKGHVGQVELDWEHAPSSKQTPERYTIYWCQTESQEHFKKCVNELQWIYVPGNFTHYQFKDLNTTLNYAFGISAEMQSGHAYVSSGFQVARCTHDTQKSIKAPAEVEFSPAREQLAEKIKLQWVNPVHCKDSAYIREYEIVVQAVGGEESKKGNVTKHVDASAENYVITGVKGGQRYRVSMRSVSDRQQSRFVSPSDTIKVLSSGIHLSSGATAGIVIGSIVCVILVVLGIFSLVRKIQEKLKPKDVKIVTPPFLSDTSPHDSEWNGNAIPLVVVGEEDWPDVTCYDMQIRRNSSYGNSTSFNKHSLNDDGEDDDEAKPMINGMLHDPDSQFTTEEVKDAPRKNMNTDDMSSFYEPLLNGSTIGNGLSAHYRPVTRDSAMGDSVSSSPEAEISLNLGGDDQFHTNHDPVVGPSSTISTQDPKNTMPKQDSSKNLDSDVSLPKKPGPFVGNSGSGITSYTVVVDPNHVKNKTQQQEHKTIEDKLAEPEDIINDAKSPVDSPKTLRPPVTLNDKGYVANMSPYAPNNTHNNQNNKETEEDNQQPVHAVNSPTTNNEYNTKEHDLGNQAPLNDKSVLTKAAPLNHEGLKGTELNENNVNNDVNDVAADTASKTVPTPINTPGFIEPSGDPHNVSNNNAVDINDSEINNLDDRLNQPKNNSMSMTDTTTNSLPAIQPENNYMSMNDNSPNSLPANVSTKTSPLALSHTKASPTKRTSLHSGYVSHSAGADVGAFSPITEPTPPDSAAAACPSENEFLAENTDADSLLPFSAPDRNENEGSMNMADGGSSSLQSHYRPVQNPGYVISPDQFNAQRTQSTFA